MTDIDYGSNPNQRTPCVLVLDASASMSEETSTGETRMDGLNNGVAELESAIKKDDVALGRVQLAIVSVGGMSWDADIMMDWTDAVNFSSFPIQTGGATPLAKGLKLALQLVEDGKSDLNAAGISYTRPWIIVISDGEPTDIELWDEAVSDCIEAEADKKAAEEKLKQDELETVEAKARVSKVEKQLAVSEEGLAKTKGSIETVTQQKKNFRKTSNRFIRKNKR